MDVALPPPKRPESRRVTEVTVRRPDSSRLGKRRSPSRPKDLVNPVHGSNDPAPVAGAVVSGPGQFRNYAAESRYVEGDPLRHGLDVKQVATTPFAMGPRSDTNFRTLDISKANEGRQNWTRIDTFLTPSGHAHDDEFGRSPRRRPTSRSRNEASAKSLAQEFVMADLSEKFAELRRQIQEDSQALLQPMQQELDEISKTKELVETVRSDNLKAVEEIRRLRSMEQHKHMLQAYPAPIDKDVFESELRRMTDAIQALSDTVTSVQEDVSSLKAGGDFMMPSGGLSFRTPAEKQSGSDETLLSIRAILSEDLSEFLMAMKEIIPTDDLKRSFKAIQEQMTEALEHLRSVHSGMENRRVEVDFTPVLDALASRALSDSIEEVRSSLDEAKAEMSSDRERVGLILSQPPAIDFSPVFECIRANKVEVDLSPVLAAVEEVNVKEDMQRQFADILADIHDRQNNMDFSELLESIKATKMRVDLNGVIASVADASEEVSNLINQMKPSLSSLEQASASTMEKLQELLQVQDKSVLSGVNSLKESTARISQQFSILLQSISESQQQEVKVNFAPVLEAIDQNKVHLDFSPVLASIKKHCNFTDMAEDIGRVLKRIDEMKVQVDFTPVLRAVREGKVDTVFEVLNAFRDQSTDTGELKDAIVSLEQATQTQLKEMKDGLQRESKEALTTDVLRAIHSREQVIDFSQIMPHLEQSKSIAESSASQTQEEVRAVKQSVVELAKVVQAIEVKPQVKVDLVRVSKLIEEQMGALNERLAEVHRAMEEQRRQLAMDQSLSHIREELSSSQRQVESLKATLDEKLDNVIVKLEDDPKGELSKEQLSETRIMSEALKERPTTAELDHRLASLVRTLQDDLQQYRQEAMSSMFQPAQFERKISDAMEAAAAQSADRDSIEMVLREMQRYKKDLQNALQARQEDGMSERIAEFKALQELNSGDLRALQDHMQSSFAEVLNEIRSERSGGVDLAPVLTSLKETQEMTQGLNDSLQAGRSTSGEPSTGTLEWQELLRVISDRFDDQNSQLRELLGNVKSLKSRNFEPIREENEESSQNLIPESIQSIQAIQMPISDGHNELLAEGRSDDRLEVLMAIRAVLTAIRELQRNLDLSHEFSALLAAINSKEVKHTPVLAALQEQKVDLHTQLDDLRELLHEGIDLRSAPSTSRRAGKAPQRGDSDGLSVAKILEAIREQKVSLDYCVAEILNNIQQKQQEMLDKLGQLTHVKQVQGVKLNGQDRKAEEIALRSTPSPQQADVRSPSPQPFHHLLRSPWIPPGVLGLEK